MKVRSHHSCDNCPSQSKGIFCGLDTLPLAEVNARKVTNTFKKGQTLFYQGNPPFGLYCISHGKIKISKIGNDGKESIVRIAKSGDILGHRSLFSNENYTATATAMEDALVCFLDKKFIYEAIHNIPSVALQFIQRLSKEMGAAENKNASLSQKSVRERLAELLLNLRTSYGINENGRIKLDIKLTREELASLVGTANETIIRCISELKEQEIIDQEGKFLYILDESKLQEIANLNY